MHLKLDNILLVLAEVQFYLRKTAVNREILCNVPVTEFVTSSGVGSCFVERSLGKWFV
jgi:hypothetical protein